MFRDERYVAGARMRSSDECSGISLLSEIIKQWLLLANSRMSGSQIVELIERFESAHAVLQVGEAKLQKAGVTPAAAERLAKPARSEQIQISRYPVRRTMRLNNRQNLSGRCRALLV